MAMQLVDANVVVLSKGNNPSLLNHDFLERNNIIPGGWAPKQVIVTAPVAAVRYDNGYTISVEATRLQFSVGGVDFSKPGWGAQVSNIASRYLDVLPHVDYTAAGFNFTYKSTTLTGDAAEQALIGAFLKPGGWQNEAGSLTGTVLELQFRKHYPHFLVKLGVEETVSNGERKLDGFVVGGNFHYDFSPQEREQRAAFIHSIAEREAQLRAYLEQLPLEL